MWKWLAVGGLVLAMSGSAQAMRVRHFTATAEPQTFVYRLNPKTHVATAFEIGGRSFTSGGACSGFARYGPIRAKENGCGDKLIMRFRSVGAPTSFVYRFWLWR